MDTIRLAALAAALAAALPAAAAERAAASLPSRPGDGRTSRVAAPPAPPAPPPGPEWRVGPGLGFESGMGDLDYSAPAVRLEAEREIRRLSPFTTVSLVASLSASHASGEETLPVVVPAFPFPIVRSATVEWDANVFEVVPAARVTYAATRTVGFFADGGAGLAYTAARVHLSPTAAGLSEEAVLSDGFGGVVRLGGGLVFTPSPRLRIGLEAIGLHLRFGDGVGTAFSVGACLSHRM